MTIRVTDERDASDRSLSAADRAYHWIRDAILTGRLPAGSHLNERELSVAIGVSRTPVREAIADQARRDNSSNEDAWKKAYMYAYEIAADYSHPEVRSASFLLTSVWNRIYRGVLVHHLDALKAAAPGHEIVYVPSHRSHMDYLLLSYLLYNKGIVPPHIVAGINLNLPVVGTILRKGGAHGPSKKALRANEANRKVFEANRARIEAENANRRSDAEKEATTFKDAQVTLIRQASNTGQLYGSVAVRDLVDALVADGHKLSKSAIVLDRPIKAIGVYDVRVALHPEVSVTVKVNVARSPEEAEMQAKGVDVMAQMFERDEAGFTEDYDPNAEPGATAEVQPQQEEQQA